MSPYTVAEPLSPPSLQAMLLLGERNPSALLPFPFFPTNDIQGGSGSPRRQAAQGSVFTAQELPEGITAGLNQVALRRVTT